uniref:Putative salivary lipocalin n=1 Tax=Ixodes ricinus TaxID=34613 RepID=A0A0K8R4K5_IXORI
MGEKETEQGKQQRREQNATRVVQMNATQWVKWRTYNVTDPFRGNHPLQCENFKVIEKRTPTNYSLQYKYRSGYSWVTLTESLILGFYYSPFPKMTCSLGGLLLAYQRTI